MKNVVEIGNLHEKYCNFSAIRQKWNKNWFDLLITRWNDQKLVLIGIFALSFIVVKNPLKWFLFHFVLPMSSSCNVHRHRIEEIVSVFLTPSACTTLLLTTMRSSSVKCLWRQLHLIHTENSPPNHCPANVRSGAYLCPGRNDVFLSGRFTARSSKCMFPLNWASAAIPWTRLELREWQEINTLSLWRTDFNPVPPSSAYRFVCLPVVVISANEPGVCRSHLLGIRCEQPSS